MSFRGCCGFPIDLSPKRQRIMWALRLVVVCELILSILAIIGSRYVDGALFIIFSAFGFYVTRTTKKSNMAVMCLLITHGIQSVWCILYLILWLCNVQVYPRPEKEWRRTILAVSIYGLTAVCLAAAVLSYLVFRELRRRMYEMQQAGAQNVDGLSDPMGSGASGGGAYQMSAHNQRVLEEREKKATKSPKAGPNNVNTAHTLSNTSSKTSSSSKPVAKTEAKKSTAAWGGSGAVGANTQAKSNPWADGRK